MAKKVTGLLPALITPFDEKGAVMTDTAKIIIDRYVEERADGVYMLGYTGEGAFTPVDQRKQWAEAVIKAAANRFPVFVHVGYSSVEDAVELAAHAKATGAFAVSSVPLQHDHTLSANTEYFKKVAAAAKGLPFYIYWTQEIVRDGSTERVGALELVEAMSKIEGFAGIKYTDGNLYFLERVKKYNPNLNILTGVDQIVIAGSLMGSDGSIGALQSVTCRHMKTMWEKLKAGDMKTALDLQVRANNIYEAVDCPEVGVIPGFKAILQHIGIPAGYPSSLAPFKAVKDEKVLEKLLKVYDENILK